MDEEAPPCANRAATAATAGGGGLSSPELKLGGHNHEPLPVLVVLMDELEDCCAGRAVDHGREGGAVRGQNGGGGPKRGHL